jgi:hypothetical protein
LKRLSPLLRLDDLISGAAFHDIYHAGQIQLLKRLRRDSKSMGA